MKWFVRLIILISYVILSMASFAQSPSLLQTFINPTPAVADNFSQAIAALGNDRVVIGAIYDDSHATNGGAVYIIRTNGTLLTTITNPNPAYTKLLTFDPSDKFGSALACLGNDRVVVGAPFNDAPPTIYVGTVYVYNTNGALVTTITNPDSIVPGKFGSSVATIGTNGILVGEWDYRIDADIDQIGRVYLFSANGALITTFDNPTPEAYDRFGYSLAALGNDRIVIGAASQDTGAVHLFGTNGILLTTITNPAPTTFDYFGFAVATAGDRIIVGCPLCDVGAEDAGAVYIFNTNGVLLNTITNPTPAFGDNFGTCLSVLGQDRLVIGADGDDTGATNAGIAYVFSINGGLMHVITNPVPAISDFFGAALAAVGSDQVVVGAPYDDAGASDSGTAYLFKIPTPPSLAIRRTTTNAVAVSWPSAASGFTLQQKTNLSGTNWTLPLETVTDNGTNKSIIIIDSSNDRFFRLFKP